MKKPAFVNKIAKEIASLRDFFQKAYSDQIAALVCSMFMMFIGFCGLSLITIALVVNIVLWIKGLIL